MSTFFVYVREDDVNKPAVRMEPYYWGDEPPEPVWCADVVVAESRQRAKYRFIKEWSNRLKDPVDYPDDWPLLRVRLLSHRDDLNEDEAWGRIHEILDHGGATCDCPEIEDMDEDKTLA